MVVGQEIVGRRSPAQNLKRYPLPNFGDLAQLAVQHITVAAAQVHRQTGVTERVFRIGEQCAIKCLRISNG